MKNMEIYLNCLYRKNNKCTAEKTTCPFRQDEFCNVAKIKKLKNERK